MMTRVSLKTSFSLHEVQLFTSLSQDLQFIEQNKHESLELPIKVES
jgi:hypothetical protein